MLIIGNRVVMGEAPQNTLASFEKALKAGLPMIEMDAQLAKTGEVVVIHDKEIGLVTKGQAVGTIKSFTFDELRKFNVYDEFDNGKFYQIPTLYEALDFVAKKAKHKPRVNIELK